ncbi:hypothetical protein [Nocardioides sp. GXQ0305]|uniref:hypothetical protein n=1 Tax=Nocardioides sp. GXQ0305 TaxID=3423912 RepID=UPI003D7E1E8B
MSLRRLCAALVLGCGVLVAPPAGAWDADHGRVWRGDGVLAPGCHDYGFRYRVRPGNNDWGLELFLVGPGREGLGTVNRLSENDPKRGRARFEVCRSSTRPGKFRIRGKLTVIRGFDTDKHWIKPARFRLRRG